MNALPTPLRGAGGLGTLAPTWVSAPGQPAVLAGEPGPAAQIVATIARKAAGVLGPPAGMAVSCR